MALSESMAAYEDCYDYFERARASTNGIRVLVGSRSEAYILRMRINHARVLQRREASRIYERNDPRWGKSENDRLRVKILETAEEDGKFWVYIEPWRQDIESIEEL